MDSRSLIRDCGRHQLVDLGAVVQHAEDEEGFVVWRGWEERERESERRRDVLERGINWRSSEGHSEGGSRTWGPTCGHGAHQHRVELDDGAEDVLGVGRAGQVLAVALEDEALVLFLEQDQDVLQQQRVELWMDGRRIKQPVRKHQGRRRRRKKKPSADYEPMVLSLFTFHDRGPSCTIRRLVRSKFWGEGERTRGGEPLSH